MMLSASIIFHAAVLLDIPSLERYYLTSSGTFTFGIPRKEGHRMSSHLKPSALTEFTQRSESAQKRFAKIFDRKNKRKSIQGLVLVCALTGVAGTLVACSNIQASAGNQHTSANQGQESSQGQPGNRVETLYQYHGTHTGDNSKVEAIVRALDYTALPMKSLEMQTDSEPYGISVNYQVDSRANYRSLEAIETAWNKNAAVMFSLIPNVGEISFRIYDQYGDFAGAYYSRENLSGRYGMEYFTADTVKQAAASPETFANYLNKVSSIKNMEDSYGELQKQSTERLKQIYSVIGDDREITPNSGVNFLIAIRDNFVASPPIKELMEQKEQFEPYKGKKIEFLIYNINNFKLNNRTFYLFAFDGAKMIAYADLKTASSEHNAIKTLNALQGERQ